MSKGYDKSLQHEVRKRAAAYYAGGMLPKAVAAELNITTQVFYEWRLTPEFKEQLAYYLDIATELNKHRLIALSADITSIGQQLTKHLLSADYTDPDVRKDAIALLRLQSQTNHAEKFMEKEAANNDTADISADVVARYKEILAMPSRVR